MPTSGKIVSPEEPLTRKQILKLYELLREVEGSLRYKRGFRWGQGVRGTWTKLLKRAGIILLTRTALAKRGLEPKRGAVPVGTAYFGAPLKVHAELFVLGVQTRKKPGAEIVRCVGVRSEESRSQP